MKIFRKLNAKEYTVDEAKENDVGPKDKATIKELKAKLEKASDDMDDHEGAASYKAAFVAAQKQYDDFMDKIATKTNAKVRVFRNARSISAADKPEYDRLNKEWVRLEREISKAYEKAGELEKQLADVKDKARKIYEGSSKFRF